MSIPHSHVSIQRLLLFQVHVVVPGVPGLWSHCVSTLHVDMWDKGINTHQRSGMPHVTPSPPHTLPVCTALALGLFWNDEFAISKEELLLQLYWGERACEIDGKMSGLWGNLQFSPRQGRTLPSYYDWEK